LTSILPAPRHLLVRLPNPLGDAVLATPALRALRRALPDTQITWAGGPAALAALSGLPDRDGVMPVAGRFRHGLLAPFRAGRMWRRAGPDAILLLTNSFSSALAARLARAGTVVGVRLHGRGLLLDRVVEQPCVVEQQGVVEQPCVVEQPGVVEQPRAGRGLQPRPMTRLYLDLVEPFGARDDGERPRLVVESFDEECAARRLSDAASGTAWLAVNPGAAFGPTKILPAARLAEAVRLVRARTGLVPLVLCGPGEERLAEEVAARIGPPVRSTHERPPDVGELKGLLVRARVLLTTDAGPRHVAEALGVPTAVVMGPTDPRWTAGSRAVVVRKEGLPCLGCHRRTCPIGHPCMETLDPGRIADAVLSALGADPPGGGSEGV
jgi:heptosyltransferase-2